MNRLNLLDMSLNISFITCLWGCVYKCDRLRENQAQRGVRIEKRSIEFLKMYCFKPTEGNG